MDGTIDIQATPPSAATPARAAFGPRVAVYVLLAVMAWAGLDLWGLGTAPFHTKGEPREALVVWEMTHGGGWILPRRNGEELPSKPPLFHWLGALTSDLHGATDEWSIRFPSAAFSLVSALCVLAAGTALWSPSAGLMSALVLMTTFEWARAATGARVDMTLTFGLQLAFLSLLFFLRTRAAGWLVPLYLGITLAVLGKGPVGVALPGLVALIMLTMARDFSPLRRMRLGAGALTVGILAGGWYVMALIEGGWQFFRKQVLAENVFTFLNSQDFGGGHRHAVTYLFGALLLGVLPWTLFVPGMAARLWRRRRELAHDDPRLYLLVWIAVVFGFYALAASKRSVYLLALYPALALLLGWWWDEQRRAPTEDRWLASALRCAGWVVMLVLAVVLTAVMLEALGAPVALTIQHWLPESARPFAPWVSDTVRAGRWPILGFLVAAVVSLWLCLWAARTEQWTGIFAGVFCTVTLLIMSVNQVILPGIARHASVRSFMDDARRLIGPADSLFFFRTFDYGAVFYWRGHIPSYDGPWPTGAPGFLLMQETEWQRIQPDGAGLYERVTFPNDDNLGDDGHLVLIRHVGER
ncbi:MAG TPA: glycosyltransferase family 39 protein [Candidatus Acidoferrales bacterium]|nr:glycosyltransferase family 39 protein [Candidatus Acidoferrales bacterium]